MTKHGLDESDDCVWGACSLTTVDFQGSLMSLKHKKTIVVYKIFHSDTKITFPAIIGRATV